ncbi:MAG: NAD(P)/FAD-dependent oxidoreductase [Alphaproteobacteria bacterium]|nr:NAD(P)/FAD-dependent oxidoreductase [Alphaproteobacteria bacterium]
MAPTVTDVLVIGAGAAGLMCAIEAGRRGRRVLVIDHNHAPAEKIRISGGGRCNFTNLHCRPDAFLSNNPQFCVSALRRFSQHDFIARLEARQIAYHEKTAGQLFCDGSAKQIIAMLLSDLHDAGADLKLGVIPGAIESTSDGFIVETASETVACSSLVIATGGKSIPKMGASGYAYDVALQFGLRLVSPRPGLVPFTVGPPALDALSALAGLSTRARVTAGEKSFEEGLLFTHRGLSGPAVLQASSYWKETSDVFIDLAPGRDVLADLKFARQERPKASLTSGLSDMLPRRLALHLAETTAGDLRLADLSDLKLRRVAEAVQAWRLRPSGTEGWRTAEVTVGGVDTRDLSSQTLEAKGRKGLFFIGECVDVTGWLGGYNFQWAWSSGWAAGQCA